MVKFGYKHAPNQNQLYFRLGQYFNNIQITNLKMLCHLLSTSYINNKQPNSTIRLNIEKLAENINIMNNSKLESFCPERYYTLRISNNKEFSDTHYLIQLHTQIHTLLQFSDTHLPQMQQEQEYLKTSRNG